MNTFLYIVTVLVWGTSWIAISLQNGSVDSVVSIFYRFGLASVLLLPFLYFTGRLEKSCLRDHFWFFLQGCCLFCFNFICFYKASQHMPSGLLSIVFSMAIFYNALNNKVFWGVSPSRSVYGAGVLGVIGLVLLFWQELQQTEASSSLLYGIGLSALGTFGFSLGNMITVRHKKNNINPLTSTAYGMSYGTVTLLVIITVTQTPITWSDTPSYMYSLVYLSVFASIIGFTAYLSLVNRIGANQAAYATVLFPVIALALSSIYEGYTWGVLNSLGLVLVLLGNAVAMNLLCWRSTGVMARST
ncbi:DMT family transporter [Leucothrix sargassi]|nr:DMT family transporter [Leucothrix sargassi]